VSPRLDADARLDLAACSFAQVQRLEHELGVSHVVAQVLARRGLGEPDEARRWLAADVAHDVDGFDGVDRAVDLVLGHVRAHTRITVHGDYDVDGVSSTAVLVRALRLLGADVDWFLPSRTEDGYGLSLATVERLAVRGTRLLVTADCAITAVEEVAAARALGLDVLVTDHHAVRADGALPDAPIFHPGVCGYPCPDLCATGVAYKLAGALHRAAGSDPALADEDLDLVALATVADVVALRDENRRLVKQGLIVLARTAKPGLRALMRVAQLDPGAVDARAVGFRLAPRINAAGRLYRADAGLELLLTDDERRAGEIAEELDRANVERRHTETRIRFEAEALLAAQGEAPAYVLAAEGWHPGVIGIVAARIAERHHRPAVLVALAPSSDGTGLRGTGSGRSIPAFDLLAGLRAAGDHLERFGGHRAAAGLELRAEALDDFRAAFVAHAGSVLSAQDMVPHERVDAVVSGDDLGMDLADELARLAPFGAGNPEVSLLVPAATLLDPVTMGEGKHVRFTVQAGGIRSRAVAFGTGGRLPVDQDTVVDATFALERNEFRGAVEPRLVLRQAAACRPDEIDCAEERERYLAAVWRELDAPLDAWPGNESAADASSVRSVRDRRGRGLAGTITSLVATGEGVIVVCADVPRRLRHLRGRLGGFALCSYEALAREPQMAAERPHLIVLDPAVHPALEALTAAGRADHFTHLAWGEAELRFAEQVHDLQYGLREPLAALYRALRDAGGAREEGLETLLRGADPNERSGAFAGRLLRVLRELELVTVDREHEEVTAPAGRRTELEASGAYREYSRRREEGLTYLRKATARAA
jgi:single-stranded-DNA-specific exonuclease